MLQSIRKATEHWLGKLVMTGIFMFLIAGLGIYGVEEFFRGGSKTTVATVGGTEIPAEEVRNAYQQQLQRYQQQLKRPLTAEQARALGLERQVLSQLIIEAALDEKTRALGLAVSDEAVLRAIRDEPTFKGANGQFDRSTFHMELSRAGVNEAIFVRKQRSVIARLQVAEAVTAALPVPLALREAVHRYSSERRAIALLMLPPSAAGEIAAPTDEQLQAYYDNEKAGFRAPETRALNLLVLEAEALAKPEAIDDAEAEKIYEVNKAKYGTAEKRTIQQITFPDEAAAEEARKKIESNEQPFEAVAVSRGVDPNNLALGTMTKAELIDPAVADAAFALEKNAVSKPVKGKFGTVLLRVTGIEPATQKPFGEVKEEIRKAMAMQRARTAVETTHDAIEDSRASGKSLAEIAKDNNLKVIEIPAVDSSGKDAAGSKVEGLPDEKDLLPAAFRAEIGGDTEALRTPTGGYVWYDVTKVDAAHDKPLAEVREEAVKGWRAAEVGKRLTAKAKDLAEKLEKGEAPETVAQEAGVEAKTVTEIARGQTKDDLQGDVIDRVFATAVGKAASASAGESRAVFKVTQAAMPAFVSGTPGDANIEKSFRTPIADDVLGQYLAEVQKDAGVKIDQTAFRRALGGEY